ncbi:MAG: hypothetical protein BroJett026_29570 [Betaproteobacteria bacterium]|nr:MAG: hypothetical protein BroJett026_29570 [Betaproteobacteria bacterium]
MAAFRLVVALVLAVALAGCSSGPPADEVRAAVQAQLDAALDGRVLTVSRFTRAGGASLREGDGRLVYFNAALALERDYDFTRWDAHNVASLAALVGAGPRGIVGLGDGGNRKGDMLGVYGSAGFRREGSSWRQVPLAGPAAGAPPASIAAGAVAGVPPGPREAPPATPLESALARLAALVREPAPVPIGEAEREAILLEEVEGAVRNARRRLEHAATLVELAAGPAGGAYAEVRAALEARAAAARVPFAAQPSAGSVANVRLLHEREVQFALVQNDVARAAYLGSGRFAGAPQHDLRAVASLFPEPVHLVTMAGRGVASVADLRGRRVNLGAEGSGTRSNATAVLAAHGLPVEALAAARDLDVPDALRALADGTLDAAFVTVHAPARELQRAFVAGQYALVPIGPAPALLDAGLVPLALPARTYARQAGPLPTVASTALVVTRSDVPDPMVDAMLAMLFERREGVPTAAVSRIGPATARVGVALPWHPRADAFLAGAGAPAPASPKADTIAPR